MDRLKEKIDSVLKYTEDDLYHSAEYGGVNSSYDLCPNCNYVTDEELSDVSNPCPNCGAVGFGRAPYDWPGPDYPSTLLLANVSDFFKLAYETTEQSYEDYAQVLSKEYDIDFSLYDLLELIKELDADELANKGANYAGIIKKKLPKPDINPLQILMDLAFFIDRANIYDKSAVIFSIMAFESYYDAILAELFNIKGHTTDFIEKKVNQTRWNIRKREECLKCLADYTVREFCEKQGIPVFTKELDVIQGLRNRLIHAKRFSAQREESIRALKFAYMVPAVFAAIHNDCLTRIKPS